MADVDRGEGTGGQEKDKVGDPQKPVDRAALRQRLQDLAVDLGPFPVLALVVPLVLRQLVPRGELCTRHGRPPVCTDHSPGAPLIDGPLC